MDILSDDGALALEMAAAEADPDSLGAAERMRRCFPPELAAAALTQVALRRRAREKLPMADRMFFTPDGLEQATRWVVAQWRAALFKEAGVTELWDLGCGLGVDAMAFAQAGLRVHAVEVDPTTAAFATANLRELDARVIEGRAEDVEVPPGAGIFLDPARRTTRGRTWDVNQFTPPWSLVENHLRGDWRTAVKLGPGLPKELIPEHVAAAWVSADGDLVETSLWNFLEAGPRAVVMRSGMVHTLRSGADPLPVGSLGDWVHEPDNAVIRAGLVAEAAPAARLLAPGVAYVTSDAPIASPFVTDFRVLEVLDYDLPILKRWVKAHRIGSLEIKRRAIDVDPAALRRQLKPRGDSHATIILARTQDGARAIVVSRHS